MRTALGSFVFTFAVWLAVTWTFDAVTLATGLVGSLLVSWSLRRLELPDAPLVLLPHRLLWVLVYVPVLLWFVLRANLDVAFRVLHPALPIRPGIVKARTTLRSVPARVLLANSITLTPGTLSVDLVDDTIYIHRIWVPETGEAEDTRRQLERFERFLRRIFE